MTFRFDNYLHGYRIVSLALDCCAKDNLLESKLETLYVSDGKITLLPEEIVLSTEGMHIKKLHEFNNFDVLEIWETGTLKRVYDDSSNENYFFVTGKCNSNCIMCPSPEVTRKNVYDTNVADLIEIARHIPSDTPHLTITGGEPFLIGEKIFPFIQVLKERFLFTEFLVLTNGRIFAIEKYVRSFVETAPCNTIVAIPIHGASEQSHDAVTRSLGSFSQTCRGIKNLLKNNIRVELRLVVTKMNISDFDNIADLIIMHFKGIEYISIIAMEMTGNAHKNREQVWVSYKESFSVISPSLHKLIKNGIDVKVYNFPLCTVEKSFWTICEKSISTDKIRFAETCSSCRVRSTCGGVFAGTFQLERNELNAIL